MTTYNVAVTREGNLWVAVAAGLLGGATDVERFADIELEVRDLIADLTDVDPESFTIRWRYEVNGQDVTAQLEQLRMIEQRLRRDQVERESARGAALDALTDAGLSQRVTADVLGLSHQRINQLIHH